MEQERQKVEEKLYRIGMFSKMNQVTIKALRYYDEVGLLRPRFIDPDNGYRYYSSSQLEPLHRLLALRRIGYSIEEMKRAQDGESEHRILQKKKQQLLKEISEENYHMVIKKLPKVIVASTRKIVPNFEALFSSIPEMGAEMERAGCVCEVPEYCFNIYHDNEYKEENIDIEVCEAVTEMKENIGNLKFKQLEEIPEAVCTMHKGSYRGIPNAYAAALKFAEDNGYEIIDSIRENCLSRLFMLR